MLGEEILNLIADAESSSVYFLAECMGRSAGWLTYGAAIAGEASLVLSVEDIPKENRTEETYQNEKTGKLETREIMDMDFVIDRIVGTMLAREKMDKAYGVIVVAEGLAELLPMKYLEDVEYDEHDHLRVADANLYSILAKLVAQKYEERTKRKRKVKGVQLGYEVRCSKPNAFDAVLGSQLGFGAYRALVEEGLDGVMVSIRGQLDLHYVDFERLVDPETLVTVVRFIKPDSDFHRLAHFLESEAS
jgi:6-phosphofructokinase 1